MPTLRRIAPELAVFYLSKSLDYYEKKLGFRRTMSIPNGDYAIVERDGVAIHLFTAGHGDGPGSILCLSKDLMSYTASSKRQARKSNKASSGSPGVIETFALSMISETRSSLQNPSKVDVSACWRIPPHPEVRRRTVSCAGPIVRVAENAIGTVAGFFYSKRRTADRKNGGPCCPLRASNA